MYHDSIRLKLMPDFLLVNQIAHIKKSKDDVHINLMDKLH